MSQDLPSFITLDAQRFGAALKALSRLAQPEVVNLHFRKRLLVLRGQGESSSCSIQLDLDTKVPEELEITLSLSVLMGVIDKCKTLKVAGQGNALLIRSKNYTADVIGIEGQPIIVVPDEVLQGEQGILLKSSFMNEVLKVLPALELRPLLSTYSEVPIGIKATKKGTFVACFDFIQSASVFLPEAQGKFEMLLPSANQFNVLAKELSGQRYQLVITDTVLYAWNDLFQVALALPQGEGEQLTINDMIGLSEQLDTMKFSTIVLDAGRLQQFLGNSRTVYDKDSEFQVTAQDREAVLQLKATVGNMKLKLKLDKPVKNPISFKCDLTFFASIVSKTKEKEVRLRVNDNLLKLGVGPISYLLSLV